MKRWKVALIGCGMIAAGNYIPEMKAHIPEAELVAVCDIDGARAREYAERFDVPQWYDDLDEMLAKCDFDILMDTSAISAHHEINMKALRAGKHLYSQKPVAATVEEVTEQIEAAKAANVKYAASPIHLLRHDVQEVKRLIEAGAIGKPTMVRCSVSHGGPEYFQYRDTDSSWFYRKGAGALVDMGIHGIALTTGIFGPAKEVSCMAAVSEAERTIRSGKLDGTVFMTGEMPDNYLISLNWGDGLIGIIDAGYCQKASTINQLEIYGTLGTIVIEGGIRIGEGDGLKLYIDDRQRGTRGWMTPMPVEAPPEPFYQCMCLKDLIRAIETDTEPVIRAEHARHVVEILEAVPRAIDEKRTVSLNTTF